MYDISKTNLYITHITPLQFSPWFLESRLHSRDGETSRSPWIILAYSEYPPNRLPEREIGSG